MRIVRFAILLVAALALLSTGCSSDGATSTEPGSVQPVISEGNPSDTETIEPEAGEAGSAAPQEDTSDPAWIQTAWETSPHNSTYVANEDGTNSACTRCHAPANWVPTMEDMPESCYSCKFEIKPPPPVVPEEDWNNIECNVCHEVKKDKVNPEISWLEIAAIEQYAEVASASELCLKCHSGAEIESHPTLSVEGAHTGMECTSCHNPHNLQANCSTSGCHEALDAAESSIPGHDEAHASVTCEACHGSGDLEVGPDEGGVWNTLIPSAGSDPIPFVSHYIVREAPCERCHFPGNPWGLLEEASPSQ